MSEALFTYGTLQFPDVMHAVVGRELPWIAAEASDFAQFRFLNRIYPGMVRRKGAKTRGRLYIALQPPTWDILDRFEDPIYHRETIEVACDDGTLMTAHAYVLPLNQEHLLSSEIWEMTWFGEHHLDGYVNRCRSFYEAVVSTKFSDTFFTRPQLGSVPYQKPKLGE